MSAPRFGSDEILRFAQDDNGYKVSLENARFRSERFDLAQSMSPEKRPCGIHPDSTGPLKLIVISA
jgi:hypothetical protein